MVSDAEKSARRFFNKIGFAYVVLLVAIYGSQLLAQFVALKVAGREIFDNPVFLSLATALPVDIIGAPILYLIIRKFETTKLEENKLGIGSIIKYTCMLGPITFAGALISSGLSLLIGRITGTVIDNNAVVESVMQLGTVGRIVTACICAPIFEELIFRKLLIDRTVKYGEAVSIVLSGVLFGLFHGNFEQFFYACFLGMFFGYIYIKTGKIQYTMLLHFFVNFTSAAVTASLITKFDVDAMQNLVSNEDALQNLSSLPPEISAMLPWFLLYTIWTLFLVMVFFAGVIFWIIELASKQRFAERECQIPRGKALRTVYCNPGMGLYIVLSLSLCVFVIISMMN